MITGIPPDVYEVDVPKILLAFTVILKFVAYDEINEFDFTFVFLNTIVLSNSPFDRPDIILDKLTSDDGVQDPVNASVYTSKGEL